MAENSHISWTDHTFNPWIGCTKVSPACDGCYAAELMGTAGSRFKRVDWGEPGKGEGTRDRTKDWMKPRKWNRQAAAAIEAWRTNPFARQETPKPATFVFCASLADVFDNAVPWEWRRDLFTLILETPHLTWLLLTKRPGMIVKLYREVYGIPWPANAAIGCTVINQEEADRDIPKLMAAKVMLNPAFAFLSMEPLLGPVDLYPWLTIQRATVNWVITGGETDQGAHKARPADPAWYRSLRDQCAVAGVPFHFKQWGEWQPAGPGGLQAGDEVFIDGDKGRVVRKKGKDRDPCTLDGVAHLARPEVAR